ncbi:MAG: beta-propeller domain-containing protein [Candidatus Nanoarchaeia archaeon]|nr:beta-propeller domain-containing protein [Candidatus Nanoarchaeia archaeon]
MDKSIIIPAVLLVFLILIVIALPAPTATQNIFDKIGQFSSEEDFISYLSESAGRSYSMYSINAMRSLAETGGAMSPSVDTAKESQSADSESSDSRYSETNVQVSGIDEPDVVKTDGINIYFSNYPSTKVISAVPAENMAISDSITGYGNLLQNENSIMIIDYSRIESYDKSNSELVWSHEFENSYYVDARLYGEYIYVITMTYINSNKPCPIGIMGGVTVRCVDIYYPIVPIEADSTYHITAINAETGEIKESVSFVGKYGQAIYMSEENIYVTYSIYNDMQMGFYLTQINDLFPQSVISRINTINNYDISEYSKKYEIELAMYSYIATLTQEQSLELQTEMFDRLEKYNDETKRELTKTGIIKVSHENGNLEVDAVAEIPGYLLNQFSLDEYNNYLRTAVTVGTSSTANDIYILDSNLQIASSILDLGITERIYSARFIEDKGYLVTFRQTDPFYVLDLSNPLSPSVSGELKIPGYSSYLHPIDEDTILGVGKEELYMKISMFDVSDASNPIETSKYSLEEYWSEALYNHRAFLIDREKEVFFLPGGKGGYVFSYNEEISLVASVPSDYGMRRAVYIGDVMYLIASEKITALDENTWEIINELELPQEDYPIFIEGERTPESSGEGVSGSTEIDIPVK